MARLDLPCATALHPRTARTHTEKFVLDRLSLRHFVECRHMFLDLPHNGVVRRTRQTDGCRRSHPVLFLYRSLPWLVRVAARVGCGTTINAHRACPRAI